MDMIFRRDFKTNVVWIKRSMRLVLDLSARKPTKPQMLFRRIVLQ